MIRRKKPLQGKQELRSKNLTVGFTLIELLVVISIIGILAALGIASYSRAEKNTRDAQRMSDLGQYRIALESYAAANNLVYPKDPYGGGYYYWGGLYSDMYHTGLCDMPISGKTFAEVYLSGKCLEDVLAESSNYIYTYTYASDGTSYAIYARLESAESAYFIICSDGKSGKSSSAPPQGFIYNGTCPLP